MNKLVTGVLVLSLILGTSAIGKAAELRLRLGDHRRDYGYTYGYRDFGHWDARMRGRLHEARREGRISNYRYYRLSHELRNIESFRHRIAYDRSSYDWARLHRMERRFDWELDRTIG